MNFYLTTGTLSFLKSIQQKHQEQNLILLANATTAALLHETTKKTLFQSPRKFEVVDQYGRIGQEGFWAMDHIPVTIEDQPTFEFQLKDRLNILNSQNGLLAYRFLRPIHSDTYVVLTVWEDEKAYTAWDHKHTIQELYAKQQKSSQVLFTGKPYVSTFYAYIEKES